MRAHQKDWELVRRAIDGEQAAFDEFFEAYFPRLYRFALVRVSGDNGLAEDVVQETLTRAIGKLKTYRGEAPLFSWLCTFCRNELSRLHRSRGQRWKARMVVDDLPHVRAALETLEDAGDGPEKRILREEIAQSVHLALDYLPRRYSDCLEWKYSDGLSVGEIAARLGVGYKAAESLLTRARNSFREGFSTISRGESALKGFGK